MFLVKLAKSFLSIILVSCLFVLRISLSWSKERERERKRGEISSGNVFEILSSLFLVFKQATQWYPFSQGFSLLIPYLNHLIPIFTQIINRHESIMSWASVGAEKERNEIFHHRRKRRRLWRMKISWQEIRICEKYESYSQSHALIHFTMIIVNDVVPPLSLFALVISLLNQNFYFMLIKHEMRRMSYIYFWISLSLSRLEWMLLCLPMVMWYLDRREILFEGKCFEALKKLIRLEIFTKI